MTPTIDLIVGAHLGQLHEHAGIVAVRRVEQLEGEFDGIRKRWPSVARYEVPYVERAEKGVALPEIVDRIEALMGRLQGRPVLVVNIAVTGRPPAKLLRQRGLRPTPVDIGERPQPRATGGAMFLPRRDLVSCLGILLGEGRLKVAAGLEHAETLAGELDAFRMEKDAGRSDALVLATIAAAWWGEHRIRSRVSQPPAPRLPIETRPPTFDEACKGARQESRMGRI